MEWVLGWLARRSLRSLHALGALLGWLVWLLSPSYRRRLHANAAQAGLSPGQRRRSVAEAGKMGTEGLRLWLRPPDDPIADPIEWHGAALIDDALRAGRGLLLLTPHLGSFELSAQAYAERWGRLKPITVLYRPARHPALRALQERARARPALAAAPADLGGVRQMLRALRRGEAVGLLPDQVPPHGQGTWAPFFGRPAYSMTLAARLALQSGAPVLLARCERLPAGRGYRLSLSPLAEPIPAAAADDDALQRAQAAVINRAMEQQIRQCPEQYLWGYNRYKLPRGSPPGAAPPP
ncbi:MAG TPA: lysophospholipid acyltransferase family protein [Rubrivivax sp.]|nr:lysophospholipid acyltransferase family protein [Rubrivivax sp.]